MGDEELRRIKRNLARDLERYINIFKQEYKDYIPSDTLKFLDSITDYEELIKIEDTGTITCFVRDKKIYFPLLADKVLKSLRTIPGFGSRKNHQTYQTDTLIINNNTFLDYIKHAFLAGLSVEEFYAEMLLHETMHMCGLAGSTAFQEGLTELKTRELAKKYNLKTSACGYPKEVKVVYRMQEIFGEELLSKIAFCMSPLERRMLIYDKFGEEGVNLFEKVVHLMEVEFNDKYYQYCFSFKGLTAPLKKAMKYNDIDYTLVHKAIDEYCNNHKKAVVNVAKS